MAIASINAKRTSIFPKDSGFSTMAAAADAAAVPRPNAAPMPVSPIANPAPSAMRPDSDSARMEKSAPGAPPLKATTTLTMAVIPIAMTTT